MECSLFEEFFERFPGTLVIVASIKRVSPCTHKRCGKPILRGHLPLLTRNFSALLYALSCTGGGAQLELSAVGGIWVANHRVAVHMNICGELVMA